MVSEGDTPRILPMGERALLLEVDSLEAAVALHRRLDTGRIPGVLDLVPAARTVLVRVDPARLTLAAARAWIAAATTDAASAPSATPAVVELEVAYDGADLDETAALLGVGADELVRRHTAAEWTVAFTGFAPGFGYLVSADWPFDVPRLPSPRTRVPRGAVGLAGEFTGAYPRETPGGWRLIGTTAAALFDPDAASPALLAPGTRVQFRAVASSRDHPLLATSPRAQVRRGWTREQGVISRRSKRQNPATCACSSPGCSRRSRTSGGPAPPRSASRRRAHSTAARRARRTGSSATPKARPWWRSRWVDSARSRGATCGSRSPVRGVRSGSRVTRSIRTRPTRGPREQSCTSTGSRTAHAPASRCAAGSRRRGCWGRARPTCSPDSARRGWPEAMSSRSRTTTTTRSRSPTWRRGERRTTTSSRSNSAPARAPTGSRHPLTGPCSRRSGRSRTTRTGSGCAWTARSWNVCATTSCRARAWCPARCRCRRAGGRRSCSPTVRSRAATR